APAAIWFAAGPANRLPAVERLAKRFRGKPEPRSERAKVALAGRPADKARHAGDWLRTDDRADRAYPAGSAQRKLWALSTRAPLASRRSIFHASGRAPGSAHSGAV